jgi:hypothetical protein
MKRVSYAYPLGCADVVISFSTYVQRVKKILICTELTKKMNDVRC